MQDFIQKWNNDPRYKTKIKLTLYTLFVVFVAIFAVSGNNNIENNEDSNSITDKFNSDYTNNENQNLNIGNIDNNENQFETQNNNYKIELPNEYNYQIDIIINETNYKYTGTKNELRENITKESSGTKKNYIYENDNYYIEQETDSYVLTNKDEVYDIIDYNYLNIKTINEYLSKSTKVNNQFVVYLKDIILGNDSEKYITITKTENNINIDYTNLVNYFDKSIDKYIVNIKIEE